MHVDNKEWNEYLKWIMSRLFQVFGPAVSFLKEHKISYYKHRASNFRMC